LGINKLPTKNEGSAAVTVGIIRIGSMAGQKMEESKWVNNALARCLVAAPQSPLRVRGGKMGICTVFSGL